MNLMPIALLAGAALLFWRLTRGLRKPWYPRFAIEAVLIVLVGGIVAIGAFGAWYEQEEVNRGEFD